MGRATAAARIGRRYLHAQSGVLQQGGAITAWERRPLPLQPCETTGRLLTARRWGVSKTGPWPSPAPVTSRHVFQRAQRGRSATPRPRPAARLHGHRQAAGDMAQPRAAPGQHPRRGPRPWQGQHIPAGTRESRPGTGPCLSCRTRQAPDEGGTGDGMSFRAGTDGHGSERRGRRLGAAGPLKAQKRDMDAAPPRRRPLRADPERGPDLDDRTRRGLPDRLDRATDVIADDRRSPYPVSHSNS